MPRGDARCWSNRCFVTVPNGLLQERDNVCNHRHLSLMLMFVVGASVGAQIPADVKNAAGCYSLTLSAWAPLIGSDSASHHVPTAIRLDTVRSTFAPGWVLSPNIVYPHGQGVPPIWMLETDTMRLAWSNGLLPTYVTLVHTGADWIGGATAESDDRSLPASSLPHARATAHRQSCPTPSQ